MSKKRFARKLGVVVAFSLLLGMGNVPNVSSAKAMESDQSFEMLQDWYNDYKVNGNEAVTGNEAVVGDEAGDQTITNHAYYYLGRSIYYVTKRTKTKVKVESVSIGYRAKRQISDGSYIYGFVTCGHGIRNSVDSRVYGSEYNAEKNRGVIGWRYISRYDGKVDASFVNMKSGHTIKTQTKGNVTITSSLKTVKAGEKVCMCGGVSGTVKNVEVVVADKDGVPVNDFGRGITYFDNLIETRSMGQAGDSGSIVYYAQTGKPRIVGIYVAGDDYGYFGFVVPVQAINKELKVKPY